MLVVYRGFAVPFQQVQQRCIKRISTVSVDRAAKFRSHREADASNLGIPSSVPRPDTYSRLHAVDAFTILRLLQLVRIGSQLDEYLDKPLLQYYFLVFDQLQSRM